METNTESYQLKWHAFGSHLHSCVAASMSMQQFTDVYLATVDGYQIAAHRFILSACSQYLQDILNMHYNAVTSTLCPILIILPSEISSKSLKILMEYMYSGKATVPKDVLENVLRGGDLLKIKGLWRPKANNAENHTGITTSEKLSSQNNDGFVEQKNIKHNVSTSEMVLVSSPTSEESTRILSSNVSKRSFRHKSVITSTNNFLDTTPNVACMKRKKKMETHTRTTSNAINKSITTPNKDSLICQPLDIEDNVVQQLNLVIKEEPIEWNEIHEHDIEEIQNGEICTNTTAIGKTCNNPTTEITIKPEIIFEGDDNDDDDIQVKNLTLLSLNSVGKIVPANARGMPFDTRECSATEGGVLYTPLMCELCSETFSLPKDWVKHVQTHTDKMPAKRQRRGRDLSDDESSNTFPPLQCDLCQTYFPTPSEWVQHIEKSHTITELRFSNIDKSNETGFTIKPSTKTKEQLKVFGIDDIQSSTASASGQQKECPVCNKTFPSHASMMIHSRTHTGERPYNCDFCFKGFNVKSNLLRHLRTLHDKIINSADIENKDIVDNT